VGVLAALLIALASAAEGEAPEIRSIEAPGATRYTLQEIQKHLRLRPGAPLRRTPEQIAASLEDRYHIDGLLAATVAGRFDPDTGTLRLEVDEGRLGELRVLGLSDKAAARAAREAGLETGGPLRESDVWAAWDRIEDASLGALERGKYRVEDATGGDATLVLEPQLHRAEASPSIAAFSGAGRRNRVDGWTQPLGLELVLFDATHYNHTRLYGRAAYASGTDDWRWHAGIERPFFARDRLVVGYEHHDVTDSDDTWRGAGLDEAVGESIWSDSFSRYFARKGDEAFAVARLSPRLQLGVNFRADRYDSLVVTNDEAEEPNPSIDAGDMRSLVASARFESGPALFEDAGAERDSRLLRSLYGTATAPPRALRLELGYEKGGGGLGGDFEFTRFIGVVRARRQLGTRHQLDLRLIGGRGSDLPRQKQFAAGGIGTLRAHPLASQQGDRLFAMSAEYGFLSGTRWPRLLAFYDGAEAWTSGAVDRPGFKSDAGAGLRWPPVGGTFVRLEWAYALDDELDDRSRTLFRVQIPF
jgi:hypothetical protein